MRRSRMPSNWMRSSLAITWACLLRNCQGFRKLSSE
jgi:hypothetical protein